jgi:hypothetical protein
MVGLVAPVEVPADLVVVLVDPAAPAEERVDPEVLVDMAAPADPAGLAQVIPILLCTIADRFRLA